jgi:general secretion pathway protein J
VAREPVRRPRPRLGLSAHGFTLVEVVLAVSILAVVALLATAALRVGLRAWEAGQRQVDAQQETRAVIELISETLEGAYPYLASPRSAQKRPVLFEGRADEVRFVTTAPPLTLETAAPFHAVVLGRGTASGPLRVLERLVPADAPFEEGREVVLSKAVSQLRLAYRDEDGGWRDAWDGRDTGGLPTAVRLELTLGSGGRARALPPIIVAIALGKRGPSGPGGPQTPLPGRR